MKIRKALAVSLLSGFTRILAVEANAATTLCAPHTLGDFSLETDERGQITRGNIGLIYKNYRKCNLGEENTRIVKEFGETVMKGECIGSAKLLYDRAAKLLYAIEPEGNRNIGISSCAQVAESIVDQRVIFEMSASVLGDDVIDFRALEQEAVDKLFAQAKQRCLEAGSNGHFRLGSALVKSANSSGHFGTRARGVAEAIFICD